MHKSQAKRQLGSSTRPHTCIWHQLQQKPRKKNSPYSRADAQAAPGRGAGREAEVGTPSRSLPSPWCRAERLYPRDVAPGRGAGKEAEVGTSEDNQELLGAARRESARIGWRRGRRCRIADRLEEKGLEPRDWRVGMARLLEQSAAADDSRCWRPAPSLFTSLLPSLIQNPHRRADTSRREV